MIEILEILIPLLCMVESSCDPNAVNLDEDAVGVLQIRPILIDDLNRLHKLDAVKMSFKLDDRKHVKDSFNICNQYLTYYGNYNRIINNKNLTVEDELVLLARIWNGGPEGHNKESTLVYGEKIRTLYKETLRFKRLQNMSYQGQGYLTDYYNDVL